MTTTLRALYEQTEPLLFLSGPELDTVNPGPAGRPAVRCSWKEAAPMEADWFTERIAAETARPRSRRRTVAVRVVEPRMVRPRVPRPRTFGVPELAALALVALAIVGAYTTVSTLIAWVTR